MQTEAVFENIAERIESEIDKAEHSIIVAVAWLTNKTLFNALVRKAKEGCSIRLAIANHKFNINSRIEYYFELEQYDCIFYMIGVNKEEEDDDNEDVKFDEDFEEEEDDDRLMHHKFCVIDNQNVITGSYNWTNAAETHHENIVIISNCSSLAKQYIDEFNQMVENDDDEEITDFEEYEEESNDYSDATKDTINSTHSSVLDKKIATNEKLIYWDLSETEQMNVISRIKISLFNRAPREIQNLLISDFLNQDILRKIKTIKFELLNNLDKEKIKNREAIYRHREERKKEEARQVKATIRSAKVKQKEILATLAEEEERKKTKLLGARMKITIDNGTVKTKRY